MARLHGSLVRLFFLSLKQYIIDRFRRIVFCWKYSITHNCSISSSTRLLLIPVTHNSAGFSVAYSESGEFVDQGLAL